MLDDIPKRSQLSVHSSQTANIIGVPVTALRLDVLVSIILEWASSHLSKCVFAANTHTLVEAHQNPYLSSILHDTDIITPDGMPLVWMIKLLNKVRNQQRITGTDLFLSLCQKAHLKNISIFLLGSQPTILNLMRLKLEREFPNLRLAGMEALPFRPLTAAENKDLIEQVNATGAGLVFVSLGCPKQELWIAEHKDKLKGVMIGVGAVFPMYAGIYKRAPGWMQESGLEWLYRLIQEPRRLWHRYRTTIPIFIWLALKQILETKVRGGARREMDHFDTTIDPY